MDNVPLYANWSFWQWVVALTALVVSLAPHVYNHLIKGAKLHLDLGKRISLQHTLGNPNVTLFLIVPNVGGKTVKVDSITMEIKKGNKTYVLPAQSYFRDEYEGKPAILPPFRLGRDLDWARATYFFPDFPREEHIQVQKMVGDLKSDILAKLPVVHHQPAGAGMPAPNQGLAEADFQHTQAVIDFFNHHFMWEVGEYQGTVTVNTVPRSASVQRSFRFTLFESESTELRNYSSDYKYGLGVYFFNAEKQPGVTVEIAE